MDLRIARTLCSGEQEYNSPGMLNIYNNQTQELTLRPFSYTPLRAVDIWLQQSNDFLLKMLSPCPEAIEDPNAFVETIKQSLQLVKLHPYPLVSVFQSNKPRAYVKGDDGQWVSVNNYSQTSPAWQNCELFPYWQTQNMSFTFTKEEYPWKGNIEEILCQMVY